jgi:hypothetical protein
VDAAAAAAEVAAVAAASVVAAVAGVVAAVGAAASVGAAVAAAAGSSGSVAAAAAAAAVAAYPGERAACVRSHEKQGCHGLVPPDNGVGRHFANVQKSSLLTARLPLALDDARN